VRRIVTIALSLLILLGLTAAGHLLAQDTPKADVSKDEAKKDTPKDEPKKDASKDETKKDASKDEATKEASKEETKKSDTPKTEAPAAPVEEPLPTIPPEVEAKLEAARKAIAEAIVAAQDAGLIESSIDPPPILDLLITGRALDERQLKKVLTQPDLQVGVNPEVFGAWFAGYGKTAGIVAQKNVRVTQPSKGLKAWYDQRAAMLNSHIEAARKAKNEAPKTDAPKTEEPKKDASKTDAPKSTDQPKDDAPKSE
jgi:pentapeptide MXKDX repeat protein